MNRRHFLGATSAALGGILLPLPAYTEQQRKKVLVDGKPAKVIDIHAHCVVPEISKLLQRTPFANREFKRWQALGPARIAEMDQRGIDMQVLSINHYWWYQADQKLAEKIVNFHDEHLANWCADHPDRFSFLSSVALQNPEKAAEHLEHAVQNLGARGASIAGHLLGEPLSNEKFDPFWAKAQDLDVPVFMHPHGAKNVIRDGGLSGRGELGNIIGNPLETTVFLSHLIFNGTLDRFPKLQICAPHAGGYLPSYLGRTEVACDVRRNADCQNLKKPSEYVKDQVTIDSMVFSEEGLRHLVAEVGPSQLVYGTDIPFNWPDTVDLIANASFLSSSEKEAILGGNLQRLLKLDS